MAKRSLNGVLRHLRTAAAVQTYRAFADGELLERFVAAQDEAAFTVLIERHGSMVLGVCRRALANVHDAEDACQAVFLVLARKAASVRRKTSLGSWLHGVASRVCASLKRDRARRRNHERRADAPPPEDPAAEVTWREVQAILDAELHRLPERYRTPFILCYLECLPRDAAAQQLGISPGSLHGRLERARDLLRERLTKRGLTLAGVVSAAAVGEGVAQAAPAPTFVVSSTKAAVLLAAGQPLTENVVSTHVLALTQEVLKTMFLTQLKIGTAAVLCAGLFAALIGSSLTSLSFAQDAKPRPSVELPDRPSAKAESDADFIRRISMDLRGTEPTPAEVHFFVASKDPGRRQRLIDLFIQERQAKQEAAAKANVTAVFLKDLAVSVTLQRGTEDKQLLHGTWKLVETQKHGKKNTAKPLPFTPHKLAFDGETVPKHLKTPRSLDPNVVVGGVDLFSNDGKAGSDLQKADGDFQLNAAKNPKELTMSWLFLQWVCIYKVEGDSLTLCFDPETYDRPKEFRTSVDSGRVLLIYERAK